MSDPCATASLLWVGTFLIVVFVVTAKTAYEAGRTRSKEK